MRGSRRGNRKGPAARWTAGELKWGTPSMSLCRPRDAAAAQCALRCGARGKALRDLQVSVGRREGGVSARRVTHSVRPSAVRGAPALAARRAPAGADKTRCRRSQRAARRFWAQPGKSIKLGLQPATDGEMRTTRTECQHRELMHESRNAPTPPANPRMHIFEEWRGRMPRAALSAPSEFRMAPAFPLLPPPGSMAPPPASASASLLAHLQCFRG
jgi:hypothetical protein